MRNFIHPSERELSSVCDAAPGASTRCGTRRMDLLTRCYGGGSSESQANPSQTTQSTTGGSSPIASGSNVPINTSSGSQLAAGGNLTITADPQVTSDALNAIAGIVAQALNNSGQTAQLVTQSNQDNANSLNNVLATVLAQDQATAANQATGGFSGSTQTILYVVAGAFALVGLLIFAFRKK